jgi:hypothetical protein
MCWQQENNSFDSGLCGLGQYLLCRINSLSAGSNELQLLTNREAMIQVVNILENEKSSQFSHLPDILSFLCRLYLFDICNPEIDRYLDRAVKGLTFQDIAKGHLPAWTLALLRITSMRHQMKEMVDLSLDRTLKSMDSPKFPDTTNCLLWLLQCKKLTGQNGFGIKQVNRLEALTDQILEQYKNGLQFEKGKLSLKGIAGVGLAMMTLSGRCGDAWLELLG